MKHTVPSVQFNNGQKCPIFGLGTWKSKPGEVTEAVKNAIEAGYRHFDCAHVYCNENEVGDAIRAKIEEGKIKREDLFVTSKLWATAMRPDLVEPAIRRTLAHLNLDYLDLYLIHSPTALKEGDELLPVGPDGKHIYSDVDYVETWKAMEKVCKKGLSKSIGISNFNRRQIERLLSQATIVPVTNQVECHPYLTQKKLTEFCHSKNILITAYSPLGSPDRPWAKPGDPQLLDDDKIKKMALKLSKSPAQLLLKYQIQLGNIVIPKSVTKSRIEENIDIFDFELSEDDMTYLDSFECNGRICNFDHVIDHQHYPFRDEY